MPLNMEPIKKSIEIFQGGALVKKFQVPDEDGNPLDMTGWTGRSQVRSAYNSESPLLDLTTANGGVIITTGYVSIYAPASDTDDLTATGNTPAVYDVEVVDLEGEVYKIAYGNASILPEATK